MASIPLAILDVSICYWILTSLQQTMRTLRVRRNVAKLTLFRHFTNTLIFCVIGELLFHYFFFFVVVEYLKFSSKCNIYDLVIKKASICYVLEGLIFNKN